MQRSGIVNLSGSSIALQVFPKLFAAPDERTHSKLYSCERLRPQLLSCYREIIDNYAKEDENQLTTIIGACVDAVAFCCEDADVQGLEGVLSEEDWLLNGCCGTH